MKRAKRLPKNPKVKIKVHHRGPVCLEGRDPMLKLNSACTSFQLIGQVI